MDEQLRAEIEKLIDERARKMADERIEAYFRVYLFGNEAMLSGESLDDRNGHDQQSTD
jgi:hypothetical protein